VALCHASINFAWVGESALRALSESSHSGSHRDDALTASSSGLIRKRNLGALSAQAAVDNEVAEKAALDVLGQSGG
jgi:hypothetical protein